MLGLRASSFSYRRRNTSDTSLPASSHSQGTPVSVQAEKDSPLAEKDTPLAAGTNPTIMASSAVDSYRINSPDPEVQVLKSIRTKGTPQNGYEGRTGTRYVSDSYTGTNAHFSAKVTLLEDIVATTRTRFLVEFEDIHEQTIMGSSIETFLDYIEHQRLTHMPHRGSVWDKVLKWAEFFALQVSAYEKVAAPYVSETKEAAKLIWIGSRVLLDLGPGKNAQALETIFGRFYKLGLSLSFFLRYSKLLGSTLYIRNETAEAFKDILAIVSDVSRHYRRKITGIASDFVILDFNQVFGRNIKAFQQRKNHIVGLLWQYKLGEDVTTKISALRDWLNPQDEATRKILDDRYSALERRNEYTCEWFEKYLLDFSRGKANILAVKGPVGFGKSILYGWILERLQRPLAKKSFSALSISIQADVRGKATNLAIAQSLVLQLLEANIGDEKLFSKLSDIHATSSRSNLQDLEAQLWEVVEVGLSSYSASSDRDTPIIVIDGLDNISAEQHGFEATIKRLETLNSKYGNVRTIILSRSYSSNSVAVQPIEITAERSRNDIKHVLETTLSSHPHFKDQSEFDRETIVEQLTNESKGSFLWATLAVDYLSKETTHSGFTKQLKECPKTLDGLLHKITTTLDVSRSDSKLLLSWLLIAERPLTLSEVKCLLQVNLPQQTVVDRKSDIREDIWHAAGPLVVIRDGIVSFSHGAIREYLFKHQAEKKLLSSKDAHTDLVQRLLAYCKVILFEPFEPTFELMDMVHVQELFHANPLLEYAVRYWILHFQRSALHKSVGVFGLPASFKTIFPGSTQLVMFEWICWELFTPASNAMRLHDLALRVRHEVFTEKHQSVLQNLIISGIFHKRFSYITEASDFFYRASCIGQAILREYSSVTLECTTKFLSLTENISFSKRNETVTRREQLLKYVILAYKRQHGKTSDVVMSYLKILAKLYKDIQEEQNAQTIGREIHELIIMRHGKGSEEETYISKELNIVIQHEEKETNVVEYERGIFKSFEGLDLWDMNRIKRTFELALSYEARGELFRAEELYINLWRRLNILSHQSHHSYGFEIHISTIDVVLGYIRFLRRSGREEEASGVLVCIWSEYAEYDFDSEAIFLSLKVVGELMVAVHLYSAAVSVFRKCWGWFESHEKHEQIASCEALISDTVQAIIKNTAAEISTVVETTVSTSTTEIVIKQVFETSLSRGVVTSETVSICKSLVDFHMRLERWSEAIEVARRSLSLTWSMIVSGNGIIALPRYFDHACIDIAIQLAICHDRLHHYHEAEEIYVRIYRACRISCQIDDERLRKSHIALTKYYEDHRNWQKLIEVHKELLVEYRKHLGASHNRTIETLYLLGTLCAEHGYGNSHEYHEEIVVVLNGTTGVCHRDAFKAMTALSQYYYEQGHWLKLKETCQVLWTAWTENPNVQVFGADSIELLFERYLYVLENHFQYDYGLVRTVCAQYRDTCVKVFGRFGGITIKAMLELARISLKSEKYLYEAIAIYEEVIDKTTITTHTSTSTTEIKAVEISVKTSTTIKEYLAKAYLTVCSHGTASSAVVEKAIKVLTERLDFLKVHLGYTHSETLKALQETVLLYSKLKTEQSHLSILAILQDTVLEILLKERHPEILHQAAIAIGGIYSSTALVSHGLELLREIRTQIITKATVSGSKFGFKIDTSVGKASFVFLATLERILQGSAAVGYSQIIADLLIESTLYAHYQDCLKSKKDISVVMVHAAALRSFLIAHHMEDQARAIEQHTYKMFIHKWGSAMKNHNAQTLEFYLSILDELADIDVEVEIEVAACRASNKKVLELLRQDRFREAYEVALCAFQFIEHCGAFNQKHNIKFGFNLSAYLVGRKLGSTPTREADPAVKDQMLALSRTIVRSVFKACRDSNINFGRLQLSELNELVGLLGQQQNYVDLEWLLNVLWASRDIHKSWSTKSESTAWRTINLGLRAVQARFLAKHISSAVELAEDISYNLRRVWGALDPKTLEVEDVLAQLYIEGGHYRQAMSLHDDILHLVVEGDDGDDRTWDLMTAPKVRTHINLLRRSYERLGGWDKDVSNYVELIDAILHMPAYKGKDEFKGLKAVKDWKTDDDSEEINDRFIVPEDWEFLTGEAEIPDGTPTAPAARTKLGIKRATNNWGIGFTHLLDSVEGHWQGDNYTPGGLSNGNGNGLSVNRLRGLSAI